MMPDFLKTSTQLVDDPFGSIKAGDAQYTPAESRVEASKNLHHLEFKCTLNSMEICFVGRCGNIQNHKVLVRVGNVKWREAGS